MPSRAGFSNKSLSSSLATGRASLSAESTMNLSGSAEVRKHVQHHLTLSHSHHGNTSPTWSGT